ncbi:uncharacterized protein LOC100273530 isoform 2 [Zea mays]|nr:uncharacterized protein LOC100273530 isoform 2 [Zea mays]ACF86348.1 unknown [Zea mays]AQL09453.1 DNA-binding bromodomain-containing protein [Zea mays]|eukprot:NP_001141420.1 uncharacterized protein LOC100273530 isoform 2 [Zea mays]
MSYNSADTIYFRQARSIEALAKKDFENLRQPSDEEEPKPPARRGRPPKNPKMEGDASPDLSNMKTSKPEDSIDTFRKKSTGDITRNTNTTMKEPSSFHSMLGSFSAKRADKIGDYSGSSKWGKKPVGVDDDRRSTYDQHYSCNSSLFAALDDGRKLLVPVGVQQQHAYARSLARFASKLGPVGWDVTANRIRRALPPGTSFGPGWVVDGEPPQNSQRGPVASTDPSSESTDPPNMPSKNDVLHQKCGLSSNGYVTGEEHLTRTQTVASTSASSEISSKVNKLENGVTKSCGGMGNTGSAGPPMQQLCLRGPEIRSNINGFPAMSNATSQYAGQGLFGSGIPMTHAQVLGMFSGMNGKANGYVHRHPVAADSLKTAAQNGDVGKAAVNPVQGAGHDPKIANGNSSAHPGLNSGVQSSGSPPRRTLANPKHPDLALQL